jgi:coenzyme F420-reducing hydrogenase gamma subunit
MSNFSKKTLSIFSLTCCEGCQFELLSFYDHFKQLLKFYDIKNFRLGQSENLPGPFDVALIEGSPDSEKQIKILRQIRKQAKTIIAIGACAHMGGIQSERNRLPRNIIAKDHIKSVSNIIKIDYTLPGCPVSHTEMVNCLIDVYWDKVFTLPDYGVCFECRQNSNKCLLKNDKPCLGPITRGGCNSICINAGEGCLGCRGPLDQANIDKMRNILEPMLENEEIENWLTIYGNLELNHKTQISNNK